MYPLDIGGVDKQPQGWNQIWKLFKMIDGWVLSPHAAAAAEGEGE